MGYAEDILQQDRVYRTSAAYLQEDDGRDDSITVEEDVTLQHLRDQGLDDIEDLAETRGEAYTEAYLDEAIATVTERFDAMGLTVEKPDISYSPGIVEEEDEPVPLARYSPSDNSITVIQAPDEDRLLDTSLLGVLAHELWHAFFEEYLRDQYGFIRGERPTQGSTSPGFNTGSDSYDIDDSIYNDPELTANSTATAMDGYGMEAANASVLDQRPDGSTEAIEVDEDMPDVHLGGLDEAFAHLITLTLDGGIDNEELRQEYWDEVVDFYNRHADKYDLYTDRTGSFGGEIAVLGEYLAGMLSDETGDTPEERFDQLAPLLDARTEAIQDGLLELDPNQGG